MRVKAIIASILQKYPPAFRVGSRVYHAARGGFVGINPSIQDVMARSFEHVRSPADGCDGDYYEFGVFRGFSLLSAYKAAGRCGFDDMRFYGFDSFQGLPSVDGPDAEGNRFFRGQFAADRKRVEENLDRAGIDWSRTALIEGFYEKTLTPQLKSCHPFRRAAVVMLDCDLYTSTIVALEWLDEYLDDGSLLIFDDWFTYGGHEHLGQPRALQEFLDSRPALSVEEVFDYEPHGRVYHLRRRAVEYDGQ